MGELNPFYSQCCFRKVENNATLRLEAMPKMLDPIEQPTDQPGTAADAAAASPRAVDWFWRPWYAKVLWVLAALYWAGLYGMLFVPAGQLNRGLAGAMVLLIIGFNPITVIAILGYGFLKAKVACGDWIIVPGQPPKSLIDPYTDPADARSGTRHLRHIGIIKDRR
jgi:hypothetical protein